MLVARVIDVFGPQIVVGVLMLIAVRLARGTGRSLEQGGWIYSNAMWRVLGRIFLCVGVYLFLTRFFR